MPHAGLVASKIKVEEVPGLDQYKAVFPSSIVLLSQDEKSVFIRPGENLAGKLPDNAWDGAETMLQNLVPKSSNSINWVMIKAGPGPRTTVLVQVQDRKRGVRKTFEEAIASGFSDG